MKDYKISDIKKICKKSHEECCFACATCPIGFELCIKIFGEIIPEEWEIDLDETDKVCEE